MVVGELPVNRLEERGGQKRGVTDAGRLAIKSRVELPVLQIISQVGA